MTEQSNQPIFRTKDGSNRLADDYTLFQQLQKTSVGTSPKSTMDQEKLGQVHQSLEQWESARETLSEIQKLLIQAYQELELMKVEK